MATLSKHSHPPVEIGPRPMTTSLPPGLARWKRPKAPWTSTLPVRRPSVPRRRLAAETKAAQKSAGKAKRP
jgi:hypothetical protein